MLLLQLITLVQYFRIVDTEILNNPESPRIFHNKLTRLRYITRNLYNDRRREAEELLAFEQRQQEQLNQEEIRQIEEQERQLQEAREYQEINDMSDTENVALSEITHVSDVHSSDLEGMGFNNINKYIKELITQLNKMK